MQTEFPAQNNSGLIRQYIAHQQTISHPAITAALPEQMPAPAPFNLADTYQSQAIPEIPEQAMPEILEQTLPPAHLAKRPRSWRIVALVLVCILAVGIYSIWYAASPSAPTTVVSTTQQHFSATPTAAPLQTVSSASPISTNGKIQVYILGAVKKPGVYTLEANARIYALLQAAGGPLPTANLVALNLAAPLSDGQEIYVTRVGETAPVSTSTTTASTSTTTTASTNATGTTGAQININTASATDMRTTLHISSTTAQKIITYRLQHGSFTSVEELLQVVSQAIYKKIKDQVKIA
jgi:competence protein ComEA